MPSVRSAVRLALGALLVAPSLTAAQAARSVNAPAQLPIKHTGKPTTAPISVADLMTRVYIFADDSLMGRQVGTEYNLKGTTYIEREVRRLGLVPAGDNGGFYQEIPLFTNYTDTLASSVKVGDQTLAYGVDFFPIPRAGRTIALDGVPVVYGGSNADSTTWPTADAVAGKIVVLTVPATGNPFRGVLFTATSRFGKAAAVMVIGLNRIPVAVLPQVARSTAVRDEPTPSGAPSSILLSTRAASLLFGSLDSLKAGTAGKSLSGSITLREEKAPGRNVVAILPGSDPKLKGQYVAIGSHNDHIGFSMRPVDHDSVRAYMSVARPQGADSPVPATITAEQTARIRAMTDSLHKVHGVRKDSIFNGADDDASGSMSVLEIAEAFAGARVKPKRSMLFVWHTGEEAGLWGSAYYTNHPTVPRDSIVAQLNLDMVGRGAASDITGENKDGSLTRGGPGYVQLVGSRRLSTELGDLVEGVNKSGKLGMKFDYGMDADGHPQNIYCRSDHYEYARYGIPVVFFTTGGHSDYHQVTDEPQYLNFKRMAEVARLVQSAALKVANLDHRVVVDKPKPDPKGRCVQ